MEQIGTVTIWYLSSGDIHGLVEAPILQPIKDTMVKAKVTDCEPRAEGIRGREVMVLRGVPMSA
jgi:hypothetical protein